jgi:hypothetical protein
MDLQLFTNIVDYCVPVHKFGQVVLEVRPFPNYRNIGNP